MSRGVSEEQKLYARWLGRGAHGGLWLLVACFAAYVLQLFEPHVPLHELPGLWIHPVERYRELTGAPAGWDWLRHLGKGDYLGAPRIGA